MKISLLVTAVWAARIAGEETEAPRTEAPSFSLAEIAAEGEAAKPSNQLQQPTPF